MYHEAVKKSRVNFTLFIFKNLLTFTIYLI
ncbi:hypothetical protein [Staphylococcus phage vB_ScaM-V1SC04]|nr:hypothetical protein [Staphylococcus phage vB_ScaM-V1SC04]